MTRQTASTLFKLSHTVAQTSPALPGGLLLAPDWLTWRAKTSAHLSVAVGACVCMRERGVDSTYSFTHWIPTPLPVLAPSLLLSYFSPSLGWLSTVFFPAFLLSLAMHIIPHPGAALELFVSQ